MIIKMLLPRLTVASAVLLVAACGGGSGEPAAGYGQLSEIKPKEGVIWSAARHPGIGFDARQDYKKAMYDDCVKDSGISGCSISGRGWFERWSQVPVIVVPRSSTQEEVWVINRAISVLNRSLPEDMRLRSSYTYQTFAGIGRENSREHAERLVRPGTIHAEIYPYDDPDSAGFAWTDGERGYAFGDERNYDFSSLDEGRVRWEMRSAVDTMVHEFLHALGLLAHPHPVHTSALSYRHHRKGEPDSVPLVDVAVLYDMYGWGYWSGGGKLFTETSGGVQFGVNNLHHGTALIPWVDAGYMAAPKPDALSGWASFKGKLVGYTASGFTANGRTRLSVNFGTSSGSAQFDNIQAYDGTTWSMWNRRGFQYDLKLYAHYFDSSTDPRDRDGIPDVVGAFYGWEAEVAAGTLQRPEITAAFGAEKN